MGRGNKGDDFLPNAPLFSRILKDYYLENNWTLILNGDVEELQRNSLEMIIRQWGGIYELFNEFGRGERLVKITGNHDNKLFSLDYPEELGKIPLCEAVRIRYGEETILVYHGHQFSLFFERFNEVLGFFLKYVGNPLQIKNRSAANSSRRRWEIEKRAYELSRENRILSIIGHTHRPLFESESKIDSLRFQIETLCQKYLASDVLPAKEVEEQIQSLKNQLDYLLRKKGKEAFVTQLYSKGLVVPCLFNSGCIIGKHGLTGIEVTGNSIALVYWLFETAPPHRGWEKHMDSELLQGYRSQESPFPSEPRIKRRIIKKDGLRNIFARLHRLA
jgi:predicted phosphodiesterase